MSSKENTKEREENTFTNAAHDATEQENVKGQSQENTPTEEQTETHEAMRETQAGTDALAQLQEKYDTLNDKYLRLYSEYENYRRRTAREILDAKLTGGSDIAQVLLPVLDDFDRAIELNKNTEDTETLKEGFTLIHSKLKRVLETKGVKEMNSLETPFDTDFHDAITHIPAPSKELKGKVIDVAEKGYFFNDKILRHAKVVVGK